MNNLLKFGADRFLQIGGRKLNLQPDSAAAYVYFV